MPNPRSMMFDDVFLMPPGLADHALVGGPWQRADLGLSYLLAASYVVKAAQEDARVSEVALPVAYLQRHALEAQLKDVLETVYRIEKYTLWLNLLQTDVAASPPTEREVKPEHSHLVIRDLLQQSLTDGNHEPLPEEVSQLCEEVSKQEAGAPERYRYHMVKRGRGRKVPLEESFPQTVALPIVEMQQKMEGVFERCFHFDPHKDADQVTWYGRLYYKAYEIGQTAEYARAESSR